MLDAVVNIAFETAKLLLKLKEKGVLQGKVIRRNGSNGAGGATLWLYDFAQGKHILSTQAAYNGSFAFGEVSPGDYRIDVKYGAYTYTDMERLFLAKGKDLFLDIQLPIDDFHYSQSKKINDTDGALSVVRDGTVLEPVHNNFKDIIFPRVGDAYSILVRNKSQRKLLAVITVDGLSVMNGVPGDYYSGGYVLSPQSEANVSGWRIDDDTVARFVFLTKEKSYAELMHKPTNIGVIACAFFEECDTSGVLFSMPSIGTGFGDAIKHRVKRVEFERESAPSVIKRIYYTASKQHALSPGFNPNPFPGCKPPPDWKP
jgi:hypothetical protein